MKTWRKYTLIALSVGMFMAFLSNELQALNHAAINSDIYDHIIAPATFENPPALPDMSAMEAEFRELQEKQKGQSKLNAFLILLIGVAIAAISILILLILNNKKNTALLNDRNKLLNTYNERLIASEKTLKETISDRNKLFSIVAHDLRNPVTAVEGLVSILQKNFDELGDEDRKEILQQIRLGTEQSSDLLDNMLMWSKSQQNLITVNKEAYPVVTLIKDSIEALRTVALKKNIELVVLNNYQGNIFVDLEMIKVVIRNLVQNAIKFSHPDSEVIIESEMIQDKLLLRIVDKGVGMNKEVLENLFSSEKKTSQQGTNGESGTGLGLIICKDFLTKNGGAVDVESVLGQGTIFTLTFDCANVA